MVLDRTFPSDHGPGLLVFLGLVTYSAMLAFHVMKFVQLQRVSRSVHFRIFDIRGLVKRMQ